MRNYTLVLFSALGLAPLVASTEVADIRAHAAGIEQDSRSIRQLLKAKEPDRAAVMDKLASTATGIEKLQTLVAAAEQANHLPARSPADWALLKEKIQLLTLFHQVKQDLVEGGDLRKQRSLLRAHADGMARRAQMLQKTAARLAQP